MKGQKGLRKKGIQMSDLIPWSWGLKSKPIALCYLLFVEREGENKAIRRVSKRKWFVSIISHEFFVANETFNISMSKTLCCAQITDLAAKNKWFVANETFNTYNSNNKS